jgi:uncharacterized protein YoxC
MKKPLGPQGLGPFAGFNLITLIINNFIPITLFVVATTLGIMLWYKDAKINSLEKKVSALQTQVDEKTSQVNLCQNNNARLQAAIKDMAEDINKISEDAKTILDSFSSFRLEVDRDFANQERRIKELRNLQTPRSCEESIDLLRKRIEEIKWKD